MLDIFSLGGYVFRFPSNFQVIKYYFSQNFDLLIGQFDGLRKNCDGLVHYIFVSTEYMKRHSDLWSSLGLKSLKAPIKTETLQI